MKVDTFLGRDVLHNTDGFRVKYREPVANHPNRKICWKVKYVMRRERLLSLPIPSCPHDACDCCNQRYFFLEGDSFVHFCPFDTVLSICGRPLFLARRQQLPQHGRFRLVVKSGEYACPDGDVRRSLRFEEVPMQGWNLDH